MIDDAEYNKLQTEIPYRCDLVDGKAMLRLASVLDKGRSRHGAETWRQIPAHSHVNHALTHIYRWLAEDEDSEPHLDHAFCRLMMAVATDKGTTL